MKKISTDTLNMERSKKLKEIGDTLRAERARRKLTIDDVVIDCGIGKNSIVSIENYKPINLNNLLDYCIYLGIKIELKGGN